MIVLAACAALALFAQQQPLPDAPKPKATPSPFQLPANTPPSRAVPASEPDGAKTKGDEDSADSSLVTLDKLSAEDRFVIKEFLGETLRPTVQRHWTALMPDIAKGKRTWYGTLKDGKTGTARITFKLHKDGSITDIKLTDSSGDDQLDRAAMQAVRDSAPLRLPNSFSKDWLSMRVAFIYNPKHPPK